MSDVPTFRTANLWWVVGIEQRSGYVVAVVTGQPHAVAKPLVPGQKIEPGRYSRFTVNGVDRGAALTSARGMIEENDGPILSEVDD